MSHARLLPTIGTPERPLRPSSLDKIVKCGVWYTMLLTEDDEAGAAAQNGSVVHAGAAAFHSAENNALAEAFAAVETAAKKFPLSDSHESLLSLKPYLADPENSQAQFAPAPYDMPRWEAAEGILRAGRPAIEVPVRLTLDPHPLDPTGLPIVIQGTLDQIRREAGDDLVCDIKTGQRTGKAMIHEYAYQLAAYTLAARQSGFPKAKPGYIIRTYSYRQKGAKLPSPMGVKWWMPFTLQGAGYLMDRVRLHVALLRGGQVDFGPGDWCTYCIFKGLDGCVPVANAKLFGLPMYPTN